MDFVSGAIGAVEQLGEMYGDYKRGRKVRLGTYKGIQGIKQFGHYNSMGKNLGIYHG
jgi:hypothetical protein